MTTPSSSPSDLPQSWAAYLSDASPTATTPTIEQFLLNGPAVLPDVTLPIAKSLLVYCDPDCSHDEWVSTGQALKLQFPDDQQAAFKLFDDWSANSIDKYPGPQGIRYQWDHFGRKEANNPVTIRSIIKRASAAGWRPPTIPQLETNESLAIKRDDQRMLRDFTKQFQDALTDNDLDTICETIRSTELFISTRKQLEDEYAEAFVRLHPDSKIAKSTAKDMLDDHLDSVVRIKSKVEKEGWHADFVHVCEGSESSFYNMATSATYGIRVFNDKYAPNLMSPIRLAQGIYKPPFEPADFTINTGLIDQVDGIRYAPGEPILFTRDNRPWVNSYRPPGWEDMSLRNCTQEENSAISTVEEHLTWMLGNDHAELLKQFLAYIVQYPGQRVRWVYTIIGPKGIGKSFIGNLMRAILGKANVRDIGQATLGHTSFNGWAAGAQLNVIEELKVDGVRKAEIMNSLKAAITNDVIDVHRKGVDATNMDATASYLAFTNYENAIAITEGERRYYIAHTTFHSASTFLADLGGRKASDEYFKHLFSIIKKHPHILYNWLKTVDTKSFTPDRAPESEDNNDMVDASMSEEEQAIKDIIHTNAAPDVNQFYIRLNSLKASVVMYPDCSNISGHKISSILRDMGYTSAAVYSFATAQTSGNSRWYVNLDAISTQGLRWNPEKPCDSMGVLQRAVLTLLSNAPH